MYINSPFSGDSALLRRIDRHDGRSLPLEAGVLVTGEHPDRSDHPDHSETRRNQPEKKAHDLNMQGGAHQGVRLTCDAQGGLPWLPSGQAYLSGGILLIAAGLALAIKAPGRAERFISVLALAGLVLSVVCGTLVSYEVGCWTD